MTPSDALPTANIGRDVSSNDGFHEIQLTPPFVASISSYSQVNYNIDTTMK